MYCSWISKIALASAFLFAHLYQMGMAARRKLGYILLAQAGYRAAFRLELLHRVDVALLDRQVMALGVVAYLVFNDLLSFFRQLVPGAQVNGQVHQIHRLVDGTSPPGGPKQNIVGHLAKSKFVVHRRAHVVSRINSALLQRREDIGTGQTHGGYTKLLEQPLPPCRQVDGSSCPSDHPESSPTSWNE